MDQIPRAEMLIIHGSLATNAFSSFQGTSDVLILKNQQFFEGYESITSQQIFQFFMPESGYSSTTNGGIIPFQIELSAQVEQNQFLLPELRTSDSASDAQPIFTKISFRSKVEGVCNVDKPLESTRVRKIVDLVIKRRQLK